MPDRPIGKPFPRKEGRKKVTGQALYIDDLTFPGMLHGATVRSPVARGRIKKDKHRLLSIPPSRSHGGRGLLDGRSDLYALGLILAELIGQRQQVPHVVQRVAQLRDVGDPPPRQRRGDLRAVDRVDGAEEVEGAADLVRLERPDQVPLDVAREVQDVFAEHRDD